MSAAASARTPRRGSVLSKSALAGLSLIFCFLALGAQLSYAAISLLHQKAPAFVRKDLKGGKIDLDSLRGKVVLLNFWATWCAPCQLEMPRFVQWQQQYGPQGLRVIGISMDDDPELVGKVDRKLHLNYPVAMGDEELGALYGGVLGLPLTFLIDRKGEVRAQFQGESDLKAMEDQINQLLSEP